MTSKQPPRDAAETIELVEGILNGILGEHGAEGPIIDGNTTTEFLERVGLDGGGLSQLSTRFAASAAAAQLVGLATPSETLIAMWLTGFHLGYLAAERTQMNEEFHNG